MCLDVCSGRMRILPDLPRRSPARKNRQSGFMAGDKAVGSRLLDHREQFINCVYNALPMAADAPDDVIQRAAFIVVDAEAGLAQGVHVAEFGARPRIVICPGQQGYDEVSLVQGVEVALENAQT